MANTSDKHVQKYYNDSNRWNHYNIYEDVDNDIQKRSELRIEHIFEISEHFISRDSFCCNRLDGNILKPLLNKNLKTFALDNLSKSALERSCIEFDCKYPAKQKPYFGDDSRL
ncbi:Hypothetical predicted protein [Octopus vulgaris]|uniref:Uncharacterized protein n=1 Tax=Octopus vulgaris TaxID=6645 RepID=A0AA36FDX2_OCTVU|nr:Hypothetical predicted protein [Octopus vulgaris]